MPRPLPLIPHGPRRSRRVERATLLFGCPRVCPQWELAALGVLMKPKEHTRGAIQHRPAEQNWPGHAPAEVEAARRLIRERLEVNFEPRLPPAGDYRLIVEVPAPRIEEAKALAAVLSKRLPDLWFVLDRLFIRNGRFFRRERGYKLNLIEVTNVHLPRPIRAALRGDI